MVSKASEDLPEPDRPVITTSRSRGMSTSMFLRLCSRAPRIAIMRPSETRASETRGSARRGSPRVLSKRSFMGQANVVRTETFCQPAGEAVENRPQAPALRRCRGLFQKRLALCPKLMQILNRTARDRKVTRGCHIRWGEGALASGGAAPGPLLARRGLRRFIRQPAAVHGPPHLVKLVLQLGALAAGRVERAFDDLPVEPFAIQDAEKLIDPFLERALARLHLVFQPRHLVGRHPSLFLGFVELRLALLERVGQRRVAIGHGGPRRLEILDVF